MCIILLGGLSPAAASPQAPARWAVVVGVGDYEHFGDEVGGDLLGTVNDARGVRDALVARWGFEPERVRMLLDEQASREAIRGALTEWLPDLVAPGDVVLVYFAGHGSQAWDENGDETDGLDETLAPWDVLPESTDRDITDDDLRSWLGALSGQSVVVILDSCHSGTATRGITPYARPRLLNRTLPSREGAPAASSAAAGNRGVPLDSEELEPMGNHVLEIAAAQADQAAMDVAWPAVDGPGIEWGGAFTTFLVRELLRSPAETTYEQLFDAATQDLKQAGFAQDPLIARQSRLRLATLFTPPGSVAHSREPAAALSVSGHVDGRTIEVSGGGAAGLSAGMLVSTEEGLFRVGRVWADGAVATAVSESATLPLPGSGLMIAALPLPPGSLRVSLQELTPADRAALRVGIAAIPGITLALDSAGVPDILLRRGVEGLEVVGMDGSVRATVAIRDTAGLGRVLATELAARGLAVLENGARPFALELRVGGTAPLKLGDPIEFRVRSGRGGFLTVIDLAPDGSTSVLLPNEVDADHRIEPDQWVVLPSRAMRDAGVFFEAQEPAGAGMVRAFVTPGPLVLPVADDGSVDPADIARALARSVGTVQDGGATMLRADTWAAAAVHYEIQR